MDKNSSPFTVFWEQNEKINVTLSQVVMNWKWNYRYLILISLNFLGKLKRNSTRQKSLTELKSISENAETDNEAKLIAVGSFTKLSEWSQLEASIETVIKSKGYEDALAIISDESVTIIVPTESLLTSQTLQIQDAVTSQYKVDLEKIKIITVK